MRFARYSKSNKHKKLKPVDPSCSIIPQNSDPRKLKKVALKEKLKIQKLSQQNIPKKAAQIFESQNYKPVKRKKTDLSSKSLLKITTNLSEGDEVGATRPVKSLPSVLQQGPYESESSFLRRLDRLCEKVRSESKIEAKYQLGDDQIDTGEEKKVTNKILRRRERDKKRKGKKKKNRRKKDDDFANLPKNDIFLPA